MTQPPSPEALARAKAIARGAVEQGQAVPADAGRVLLAALDHYETEASR